MAVGIFYYAGSRLIVAESAHDELLERVVAAADRVRVGDPLTAAYAHRALAMVSTWLPTVVADGANASAR